GSYFLVSDHCAQDDALKTLKESKTPNLHKVQGQAAIYASGQPSVNGLQKILKAFKDEGHEVSLTQRPFIFPARGGELVNRTLLCDKRFCSMGLSCGGRLVILQY
ncbi:hypothetical protein BaRGS_00039969, partial [Batillaria attramentaria]